MQSYAIAALLIPALAASAAEAWFFVPEAPAAADELTLIADQAALPPRFADQTPDFRAETRSFTFQGPTGPYQQELTLLRDRGRIVAVISGRPQIELRTGDPAKTETELVLPRYHNAHTNIRMTAIPWVESWGANGDEMGGRAEGGGTSIVWRQWQVWKPGNAKADRPGWCAYAFTLRLDPRLGYVIELDARWESTVNRKGTSGKPIDGFEYTNLLNGQMSSVWPERQRFARTVYTPRDGDSRAGSRLAGWTSHTWAGEISDNKGRRPLVRDAGLVGFLDRDAGVFLSTRSPGLPLSLNTCNVWQDQHQHLDFPKQPESDGVYRLRWQSRLCAPPAEFSRAVWDAMTVDTFGGLAWPVIRFGQDEDFEDQPIPLSKPVRGYATHGLKISEEKARSGRRSMLVSDVMPGASEEARAANSYQGRGGFIHLPQIELAPFSRYRFRAWMLVEGDGTLARLTADTYEWSPHDKTRLQRNESPWLPTAATWQESVVEVVTGPVDISVDLRFEVRGSGRAYIDDCRFERLGAADGK